jgi:hypothetical protein
MGLLSKLYSLAGSLTNRDDPNDTIGELVDIDEVNLDRRECAAKLELLEHELDQTENNFGIILDKARSAEDPERFYNKALSLLGDFEQKQSEYESAAEGYVILSTMIRFAEQYEEVSLTTLDDSDELSDRQCEIVRKLRQDQRIREIQRVLDRQIDNSEIPDEYRNHSDEFGYDFTDDGMYPADKRRSQPGIAWFDQIVDEILPDDNAEDPECWSFQDERSEISSSGNRSTDSD